MLYVIDGYNVTRSDPATRDLPLDRQRDALIARLRARGAELLGRGRIVVVFDAERATGAPAAPNMEPVEVVFARRGSADDEIVRIIQGAAARETVTVVTSDNALAARARTHGGGRVRIRARDVVFDAGGRGRARIGPKRYPASGAGIPAGGNAITAELKELWLTEESEE